MEAAKSHRRLIVLTIIVGLCFVGLGCRLADLQWARHDEFRALAENQHRHSYFREAPRGDIRDRRGNLLATSTPVKNICADPALLKKYSTEMARVLAPLLKTNETVLAGLLSRYTRTNSEGEAVPNHWVLLRKKVSVEDWERIQDVLAQQFTNSISGRKLKKSDINELQIVWKRSIYSEEDQIRTYPNGQLAAHILGFTGPAPIVVRGETNSITTGLEGIERTFDDKVRGARGWVKTEKNSRRQELFMFREQDVAARPGLSVMLTIDMRIQQIVEEELAPMMAKHSPQCASAIVLRPRTGEILAMATLPTFDPNAPGRYPGEARRNRILTDTFEPGSTFKTMILAGALNDGIVRLTDQYDCENGYFHFAGRVLHDHEHYGVMSVEQIIAKSSNIGTAKVAIKMGKERTYAHIMEFGFGERTRIPLTGEAPGYIPKPADWKLIHISRIPIGQGVSATPLQMMMAMAAVANGGVLMRPMLVDSLVDDQGQTVVKYQPQVVRRVISESAAKGSVQALKSVIERGTAEKAALEHYTVAGKTGTAQKVVNGEYSHEKYYSSFIGFFPADDPELCILVSADEPVKRTGYYGGIVCGPVFKRIAERSANFLNIKPDMMSRTNDVLVSETPVEQSDGSRVRGRF